MQRSKVRWMLVFTNQLEQVTKKKNRHSDANEYAGQQRVVCTTMHCTKTESE